MSLINQMLRDLEARGAGGSNRSAKSGSAGARPRRGAAIGRLLLLGVLLLAASAYGLREYGFWNGSVLAEIFGVSTTVTGRKPERASMNDGSDATAAPQEKEALAATADDDPTATDAAPPEEPAKPEKADPAAGAGESATPSETATASAERSRAEPGPAADDRTPEETTAPAAAREQGAAEAERRPAAPAREEPEGAVGYALQLGTFSENGNPRAFRAGLPGPVRPDAYLYETADGFTAVRYGFAARVSGLNPAMEFLRAHGLDPVVVESVRKPAASRPEPSAAKKTAPEPANKPAAAAAEPTGEGADGEREGTEAREGPGRMEKRPHRPGPAERAAQHLDEGRRRVEAGNLAAAEERLRRAVELDPGRPAARTLLAKVLLRRGRAVEAKALLGAALEQRPDRLVDRELLARIRVREGSLEAAVRLLETGLEHAGDDADYLALLAALYQRVGRYTDSAETYRAALARRPSTGVWWMGLGISLEGAGGKAEAEKAYRRALGQTSDPQLEAYVRDRLQDLAEEGR